MNYLIDTNICIFYLKGKFDLVTKFEEIGLANCFISEITVAELKFGAENSDNPVKNRKLVEDFISRFNIVPIYNCLTVYAKEKSRLRKLGTPLDDFDLLIGSTAVSSKMIMISNNLKHLSRIKHIKLEDWTKPSSPLPTFGLSA